ncbi:MAG: protein kinase [Vicinamibacterales bacterium]
MTLSPGTRLGHYDVVSLLGSGGMGEVYRARDTRPALAREVAIKVLSGAASEDESRRRFEGEARATGALNHPNILAIYDVGTHDGLLYLVEELVDGTTLREVLSKGPLPLRKAVDYGRAIAQGLAAAHAKNIIHRDLKPENVMVTRDGRLKILDFGLAKLHQPGHASDASTQTHQTGPGTILGTVSYMSPEQVRGQVLDARSDLFSLGVLLYEMVSGRRPFSGETAPDTQAAILNADPPELPVDGACPPSLEAVIRRCLEKVPDQRFQTASDLQFALGALLSGKGAAVAALPSPAPRQRLRAWHAAALTTLALGTGVGIGGMRLPRGSERPHVPTRLSVEVPSDVRIGGGSSAVSPARILALSPDGRTVAFSATGNDGLTRIWVRSLDNEGIRPLPDSEDATFPFWSPDGKSVAFYARAALRRIDLGGERAATICQVTANLAGATWGTSGDILFSTIAPGTPIMRVSADGGQPSPVMDVQQSSGETRQLSPFLLPDGDHFLFLSVGTPTDPSGASGLFVGSMSRRDRKKLQPVGSNAQFTQGHLFFLDGQTLKSQPFDVQQLELTGQPTVVAEAVSTGGPALVRGAFSASRAGTLAFLHGNSQATTSLTWVNRSGNPLGTVGQPGGYEELELSPDGRRAAVSLRDPATGNIDIWLVDTISGTPTRFTFEPGEDRSPVWSPDGSRLAYLSRRAGGGGIYVKASSGVGNESQLLPFSDTVLGPLAWHTNANALLIASPTPADIFKLSLSKPSKPTDWLRTPASENFARISPNGKWVAYASNDANRMQVYVEPFDRVGGRYQVSTNGGEFPRWRRDGSELYFLTLNRQLMAVPVNTASDGFEFESPKPLFSTRASTATAGWFPYDVSPDGQRFLISQPTQSMSTSSINIVMDWASSLKP